MAPVAVPFEVEASCCMSAAEEEDEDDPVVPGTGNDPLAANGKGEKVTMLVVI